AVSGRDDLKSHVASDEFEAVVGADAAALQVGAEGGAASRAHHRRVRDFCAHHNRLTAPMPFRAGLFAGAPGGLVLVRLAGFLGRSVGRIGVGAVRVGRNRFASLFTPIGVVARRRTRTGRRILARAVGNKRANSCNRQANSSSCSRDIPARSERLISFSSGANRRGTSSVESHSRQSASPLKTIRPRPSPPSSDQSKGDVNGYSLATAPSVRSYEPKGEKEHNRSDGGVDRETDNAGAEINSEAMEKPVADESANNANSHVADETESVSSDNLARE